MFQCFTASPGLCSWPPLTAATAQPLAYNCNSHSSTSPPSLSTSSLSRTPQIHFLSHFSGSQGLPEVGTVSASDVMDDGSPIRLAVTIDRRDGSAVFDFEGTGGCSYEITVGMLAAVVPPRCLFASFPSHVSAWEAAGLWAHGPCCYVWHRLDPVPDTFFTIGTPCPCLLHNCGPCSLVPFWESDVLPVQTPHALSTDPLPPETKPSLPCHVLVCCCPQVLRCMATTTHPLLSPHQPSSTP